MLFRSCSRVLERARTELAEALEDMRVHEVRVENLHARLEVSRKGLAEKHAEEAAAKNSTNAPKTSAASLPKLPAATCKRYEVSQNCLGARTSFSICCARGVDSTRQYGNAASE